MQLLNTAGALATDLRARSPQRQHLDGIKFVDRVLKRQLLRVARLRAIRVNVALRGLDGDAIDGLPAFEDLYRGRGMTMTGYYVRRSRSCTE